MEFKLNSTLLKTNLISGQIFNNFTNISDYTNEFNNKTSKIPIITNSLLNYNIFSSIISEDSLKVKDNTTNVLISNNITEKPKEKMDLIKSINSTYFTNNNFLNDNSNIIITEFNSKENGIKFVSNNLYLKNITKTANYSIINDTLNELNISKNINNQSIDLIPSNNKTITLINKALGTNYVLGFGICILIILIFLIILIRYCLRKKRKSKMNSAANFDLNRINFQNPGLKMPYNKLQNTSNINPGMNINNNSISEIKVQNLKDEIHNIITNSSGSSNSSGKKRREKKRGNKNKSTPGVSEQQINKGLEFNINNQNNQYAIDENLN